jgi:hypothetical protein
MRCDCDYESPKVPLAGSRFVLNRLRTNPRVDVVALDPVVIILGVPIRTALRRFMPEERPREWLPFTCSRLSQIRCLRSVILAVSLLEANHAHAQQNRANEEQGSGQPGTKWSEDQLRKAVAKATYRP